MFSVADREHLDVTIHGTREGLGIRIVGGYSTATSTEDFGIFVKEVLKGSLASRDGMCLLVHAVMHEDTLQVSCREAISSWKLMELV